jgi:hypothetical protein
MVVERNDGSGREFKAWEDVIKELDRRELEWVEQDLGGAMYREGYVGRRDIYNSCKEFEKYAAYLDLEHGRIAENYAQAKGRLIKELAEAKAMQSAGLIISSDYVVGGKDLRDMSDSELNEYRAMLTGQYGISTGGQLNWYNNSETAHVTEASFGCVMLPDGINVSGEPLVWEPVKNVKGGSPTGGAISGGGSGGNAPADGYVAVFNGACWDYVKQDEYVKHAEWVGLGGSITNVAPVGVNGQYEPVSFWVERYEGLEKAKDSNNGDKEFYDLYYELKSKLKELDGQGAAGRLYFSGTNGVRAEGLGLYPARLDGAYQGRREEALLIQTEFEAARLKYERAMRDINAGAVRRLEEIETDLGRDLRVGGEVSGVDTLALLALCHKEVVINPATDWTFTDEGRGPAAGGVYKDPFSGFGAYREQMLDIMTTDTMDVPGPRMEYLALYGKPASDTDLPGEHLEGDLAEMYKLYKQAKAELGGGAAG